MMTRDHEDLLVNPRSAPSARNGYIGEYMPCTPGIALKTVLFKVRTTQYTAIIFVKKLFTMTQ